VESKTPRRVKRGPRVIVLTSGGIDSAVVMAVYARERRDAVGVFIDYGQPARRSEWAAARALAAHYAVPVRRIKLGFHLPSEKGEFLFRNAILALTAAATTKERPLVVALGVHSGSHYYDTTPAFLDDLQRLVDGYSNGTVSIGRPLLKMNKAMIVEYARRHRVPLRLTYSCETRSGSACGECPSCMDREANRVR